MIKKNILIWNTNKLTVWLNQERPESSSSCPVIFIHFIIFVDIWFDPSHQRTGFSLRVLCLGHDGKNWLQRKQKVINLFLQAHNSTLVFFNWLLKLIIS